MLLQKACCGVSKMPNPSFEPTSLGKPMAAAQLQRYEKRKDRYQDGYHVHCSACWLAVVRRRQSAKAKSNGHYPDNPTFEGSESMLRAPVGHLAHVCSGISPCHPRGGRVCLLRARYLCLSCRVFAWFHPQPHPLECSSMMTTHVCTATTMGRPMTTSAVKSHGMRRTFSTRLLKFFLHLRQVDAAVLVPFLAEPRQCILLDGLQQPGLNLPPQPADLLHVTRHIPPRRLDQRLGAGLRRRSYCFAQLMQASRSPCGSAA